MIAAVILIAISLYFACGFAFAIPFVFAGVKQIDPHAAQGSWGFRVMIFPGVMALWPLLLNRRLRGMSEPPEERTAHRKLAPSGSAYFKHPAAPHS